MTRLSVRAEIIKLTRQRGPLFWGFLFIPLFTTLVTLLLVGGGPPPLATARAANAIQPLHAAARALNVGGNPIAQLFYAIGGYRARRAVRAGDAARLVCREPWRHDLPLFTPGSGQRINRARSFRRDQLAAPGRLTPVPRKRSALRGAGAGR